MASLPDMVTRLVADTSNFQRGMTSAQQTINKFATATLAIGGVAAVGLVKLAADAETMAVKFKVLLKSGTAAAAMIGESPSVRTGESALVCATGRATSASLACRSEISSV